YGCAEGLRAQSGDFAALRLRSPRHFWADARLQNAARFWSAAMEPDEVSGIAALATEAPALWMRRGTSRSKRRLRCATSPQSKILLGRRAPPKPRQVLD